MDAYEIGRTLRVERERRRVSLDAVARVTMVRRDYLEHIEAGRLSALPSGAYARGFIRAYARYLELDPDPFVSAYEQMCADPAPELSAVVRRPVRMPNAVQPRAWRMAAGAAVGVLVFLGLLGAMSSDDPEPPPPEIAAETNPEATPAPNPLGAVVRVEVVTDRTWVQVEADGEEIFAGTLAEGDEQTFRADESLYLVLGKAGAARIIANGQDVGIPPYDTYRGTFTPRTQELPPSQPR